MPSTLPAYRRASDEGADALECDVRLTADGHLVCVHDRRVERTSDGHGRVSSLELAELNALDFGSWKHPSRGLDQEAPDLDPHGRGVLTLVTLLETVATPLSLDDQETVRPLNGLPPASRGVAVSCLV